MYGMKTAVNGCMDLLHAGHINVIQLALQYAQGGKVLILLNSDKSIKRTKGEGRPYQDIVTRAHNIEKVVTAWCQKHNDYPRVEIAIFDTEEELLDRLAKFQPHMIVRGHDRPIEEITYFGYWPILIVPRTVDRNGVEVSTTRTAKERNAE